MPIYVYINGQTFSSVFEQFSFTPKFFRLKMQKSYFFRKKMCLLCLCARLFICVLWSPAGKGLTSWLSCVVSNCEFVTFPLGPGSGVVLDCIDS